MSALLLFDIDGTIFDDRHCLPDSVLPAMEAARGNGHRLVINTGRTLCNLDHRLDGFPLDGWIMGCGTRIVYHGETLQSMEYPPADTLRLRQVFLDLRIPTVYECDTGLYFDPEGPSGPGDAFFRDWAVRLGIFREVTGGDPEFRAVKMFCFADRERMERLKVRTAEIGLPYEAINRGTDAWEVVPCGYSKGTGVDFLRERLGVALKDCYAFGDSNNDLAMFAHAGVSVAMGSATDEVKSVCTFVTDRPERDGIAKAMKHFGLI